MASTYEIIRALPGKGYNWTGFCAALRALIEAEHITARTERRWAEKGIRAARGAAMEMACLFVGRQSVRSTFIAPSEETLAWGGFLGGETTVTIDTDAAQAATAKVEQLAKQFAA